MVQKDLQMAKVFINTIHSSHIPAHTRTYPHYTRFALEVQQLMDTSVTRVRHVGRSVWASGGGGKESRKVSGG